MPSSFVAYIDESGDEGFRFAGGSSQWFFLSAVVVTRADDLGLVALMNQCRTRCARGGKDMHFRKLGHPQRVAWIDEIAKSPVATITIGCFKPDLNRTKVLQKGHKLYFYLTRFLIERISWHCRDSMHLIKDGSDGSAHLYFSNRASMRYSEIQDYLGWIRHDSRVKIHWPAINRKQIQPLPHRNRDGLQVADAIASAWFHAFEPSPQNTTEPRYARDALPRAYRYYKTLKSYGLKLFPRSAEDRVWADSQFDWLSK